MTDGKKSSPVSLLDLPNDFLFNCLACVSRLDYWTLSLVSKKFRTLLESYELYHTRKLLGRTESCLYVSLKLESERDSRWFTLCRRPYRILTNPTKKKEEKPTENLLASVPTPSISPSSSLIAFGSNIYKIGGFIDFLPSSKVFFMDCQSHTWHEAPSMLMAKKDPLVSVIDGKIYVVESYVSDQSSSDLIEVFDPKTQIWEVVPNPSADIRLSVTLKSLAIDGNLYLLGEKEVVYNPKETKWDVVEGSETFLAWVRNYSYCVIDNIIYSYRLKKPGELEWCDSKARLWRRLKGLEKLTELVQHSFCVELADYGGKIAVLWTEENVLANDHKKTMIWCAEISLKRRDEQEMYGEIEWYNVVLTVPKLCHLLQCLAVTV